ncbi:MAG TPA: VOC family protein [Candidatus Binataceae bacterium]|nr:VOC family protein [Candidatus Binataceae bacterium]
MFNGIDHFVIVVPELEAAIRDYTAAGFTVVRGGRHNIGSHNALIALADGAYIELIAFLNSVGGHPWYAALEKGGGLVDFCMQTDDLEADAQAMRQAGVPMSAANPMTRDRPDGFRVSWVLSIPGAPFNGRAPFLIKDETPRDERVPRQQSHRNGVTGLKTMTVAVADPGATSVPYARVLGRPAVPIQRPDLDGAGVRFTVGPHAIELVAPKSGEGPLVDWIKLRGQSPYGVVLAGGPGARVDPALLQGARLTTG